MLKLLAGCEKTSIPAYKLCVLQTLKVSMPVLQVPRRTVCTGYGDGGAYAQLCGIWAATVYPLAAVRVITFGAPTVSAARMSI